MHICLIFLEGLFFSYMQAFTIKRKLCYIINKVKYFIIRVVLKECMLNGGNQKTLEKARHQRAEHP